MWPDSVWGTLTGELHKPELGGSGIELGIGVGPELYSSISSHGRGCLGNR